EDLALDDAVRLHLPQLLDQHFLGDSVEQTPQFSSPHTFALQFVEDQRLPFAADDFERGTNSTVVRLGRTHAALSILTKKCVPYILVRTCRYQLYIPILDAHSFIGNSDMDRIAVIGLGQMGATLANLVLQEHREVHVWNRTPAKAEALAAAGALVARN